jgi:uncharacterized FAD-dependent dehydrogenase
MLRISEIRLPLDHGPDAVDLAVVALLGIAKSDLVSSRVARRANDARKKSAIVLVYSIDIEVVDEDVVLARCAGDPRIRRTPDTSYRFVSRPSESTAKRPVIIGAGPCGLFAALILAQMGLRPIIVDRGKVVRERTKDTWGLWRQGVLHPESNVQFGEGGAGTFSDGKLWSQIKDPRHLGRKVLTEMVEAGAPAEILTEAHPHIGTFRLVTVVENLRRTIEGLGGEYRFESKVSDFDVEVATDGSRRLRGLHFEEGGYLATDEVILAVGHSARDTFDALHRRGIYLEAKPFSIGVRIEHPQSWIDNARFGACAGHPDLGAAAYTLSHHCISDANLGRTVYSFCMCPGGTVVAAASEPGRLVVNGMSQYSRNERNANSGLVVGIDPARDYPGDPLAGMALQRHWEALAFEAGGSNYNAPVQTVGDFLAARASTSLGQVVPSYRPGVCPTDLSSCLPEFVVSAIREALPVFGRQIRKYDHPEAVLTGIEARTSSPVRITRGTDFQSVNTERLFPAGEGAGYAGGILSAAIDGIKVAEAVALRMAEAA